MARAWEERAKVSAHDIQDGAVPAVKPRKQNMAGEELPMTHGELVEAEEKQRFEVIGEAPRQMQNYVAPSNQAKRATMLVEQGIVVIDLEDRQRVRITRLADNDQWTFSLDEFMAIADTVSEVSMDIKVIRANEVLHNESS